MLNRDAPSRSATAKTTSAGMIGKGVTARSPLNIPLRHTESMTTTNAAPGLGSPSGALEPLAVELRGLHMNFGSVQAVDGIDLRIASGKIFTLLGPNGAGKTSTIDVILGLSRP